MSGVHPACSNPRKNDPVTTPKHLQKGYVDCPVSDNNKEEKRKEMVKFLDQWVEQIKQECDLDKKSNNVCARCYPEFTCLAPLDYKRPFCFKREEPPLITNIPILQTRFTTVKKNAVQDQQGVNKVLLVDDHREVPVWERPRIKSQKLIGGQFTQITHCFKKNGLLPSEHCPRTPSCQLIQSLNEWIELDKKQQERKPPPQQDCCCCPGRQSNLPGFKCSPCDPPKKPQPRNYTGAVYGGVVGKKDPPRHDHCHPPNKNACRHSTRQPSEQIATREKNW